MIPSYYDNIIKAHKTKLDQTRETLKNSKTLSDFVTAEGEVDSHLAQILSAGNEKMHMLKSINPRSKKSCKAEALVIKTLSDINIRKEMYSGVVKGFMEQIMEEEEKLQALTRNSSNHKIQDEIAHAGDEITRMLKEAVDLQVLQVNLNYGLPLEYRDASLREQERHLEENRTRLEKRPVRGNWVTKED